MADRFVSNLECFLMSVQTDNETEDTTELAADVAEVLEGSSTDIAIESSPVKIVSAVFDQEIAVPGKQDANATLIFPVRPWGTGITPDWVKCMQCADFTLTGVGGYHILTASSVGGSSGTIWHYEGKTGTTNLTKLYNWKTDFKISGEAGKIVKVEFAGKGVHSSFGAGTMPTIVRNRTVVPAFLSATVSINGSAYKVISFDISGNQAIENCFDPTSATASGQSVMTDREIKMNCKVYMEARGTIDPIAAIKAQTIGVITLYWGTTSSCKLDATYSQIVDAKRSDQNGIKCWDLTLNLTRNNFIVSVAGGAT